MKTMLSAAQAAKMEIAPVDLEQLFIFMVKGER